MAQLEVLFLGTDKPMVPLHSACSGKVFTHAHTSQPSAFIQVVHNLRKMHWVERGMKDSHWVYVA